MRAQKSTCNIDLDYRFYMDLRKHKRNKLKKRGCNHSGLLPEKQPSEIRILESLAFQKIENN